MPMLKEFRDFAMRGNVVDLAIGVIIGAAFGNIVNSLVNDVIMPPIGLAIGGIDFSKLAWILSPAHIGPDGVEKPATIIGYGKFINFIISFLIVAWAMFLIVKGMNMLRRKEAEKPADPPAPTTEEKLLTEIRDLLAKRP
ncbi:MAG: large-conductance mechanosensitive channel protein MscL [Hyphomonadaceae bacterium]